MSHPTTELRGLYNHQAKVYSNPGCSSPAKGDTLTQATVSHPIVQPKGNIVFPMNLGKLTDIIIYISNF